MASRSCARLYASLCSWGPGPSLLLKPRHLGAQSGSVTAALQCAHLHGVAAQGRNDGVAGALDSLQWSGAAKTVAQAVTLPSAWYTDPTVLQHEKSSVFFSSWQYAGHTSQVAAPGDYLTGEVMGCRYIVCRSEDGQLRAFHNVCRHHAAAVVQGQGNCSHFECPYHGWTYDTLGRLRKATRLKGIEGFRASANGLLPIELSCLGPLMFLRIRSQQRGQGQQGQGQQQGQQGQHEQEEEQAQQQAWEAAPAARTQHSASQQQQQGLSQQPGQAQQQRGSGTNALDGVAAWLGRGGSELLRRMHGIRSMVPVAQRQYDISCNWKVFCDNYLDGGYHVPHAHKGLAGGLDLGSYSHEIYEKLSLQLCGVAGSSRSGGGSEGGSGAAGAGAADARLSGSDAVYAFIYPNLMVNRYGPWMDVNLVLPLGHDRCRVMFWYFLEPGRAGDEAFISSSLQASDVVQQEDIGLCEMVQGGLASPGYDVGRYAPELEGPMFAFHQLLYRDVGPSLGLAA